MKNITTFFLLLLSFTTAFAETYTPKIGYVNIDNLIKSSPRLVQGYQIINEEFQGRKERLLDLDQELLAAFEKFKEEKDTLSEADVQERIQTLNTQKQSLDNKVKAFIKNLTERKKEELDKTLEAINKSIGAVSETHKFDLILHKGVLFVSKELNITELVKDELKQAFE